MPEDIPAFGHPARRLWSFEPGIHYLNHGAFGATPIPVLQAQAEWRRRMEAQPTRFLTGELPGALRAAAEALAAYLGARPGSLAFVDNATAGVNAVLRSFPWCRGDGILIADRAYPAVRNLVDWVARRHDLEVSVARIPFPLSGEEEIVEAYLGAVTPCSRLAIVDQVFSALALVAPAARLVAALRERGLQVLVDAAHGPGMLDLDLSALDADWTTGNAHKWLFAPRGCAFLHCPGPAAASLQPPVISGLGGGEFPQSFDWVGTRDYSSWLAVTAALAFVQRLGAARYRCWLAEQVGAATQLLTARWGVAPPAPAALFAGMATLPLPWRGKADSAAAALLQERLWREQRIEVPVRAHDGGLWVRLSAQVYNDLSDYEALAAAVSEP